MEQFAQFILQYLIALIAVVAAGAQHLALLDNTAKRMKRSTKPRWLRFQTILVMAAVGQAVAALIFAVTFVISNALGLGEFKEVGFPGWADLYGFSLVNLTTLGLGDLVPLGNLKVLAGIEAMTGFLLITCSASHAYAITKEE